VGQSLGASIGTSLLNTIFAGAVASYLVAHPSSAGLIRHVSLTGLAFAHGYDTAFWWASAIAAGGAVVAGLLFRAGPLAGRTPSGLQAVPAADVVTANSSTA